MAASALGHQIQTTNFFTRKDDIPVDSTKVETRHISNENTVNPTIKVTFSASNDAVKNYTTVTTLAEKIFTGTREDFARNTTTTSTKDDFSNIETVTEFNCRQLKDRTSVSTHDLFHTIDTDIK